MLRQLFKNKKAQNTAEYALLIALVIAGVVAMQTYAQRALSARLRDASINMRAQTNQLGNTDQYEPYYLQKNAVITTNSVSSKRLADGTSAADDFSNRVKEANSFESSSYNTAIAVGAQTGMGSGI